MAEARKPFLRRLAAMERERDSYISHWLELSDYIKPRRGRFLERDNQTNKGSKRNQKIIDSTATFALRTLGSGMMAGITSPARPWFRLATPDPGLMEFAPVKEWLYQVERLMREIFNKSNLYHALPGIYEELGLFGTGGMLVLEDFKNVIRTYPLTAGEYVIGLNETLGVDTVYREFDLTVSQLVQRFGKAQCSEHVRTQFDRGNLDAWIKVVHVIEPREVHKNAPGAKHMPFRSVYFEKNGHDDQLLSESGFKGFPGMFPRWHVLGTDVYGTDCPGMVALGDVKQLQKEQLRKAQGIDKIVNPPMVGPPELRNEVATTLPGGVTYVSSQNPQGGFRPAYEVNLRLSELTEDIRDTQQRILTAFFADLFQMLSLTDRRQITAREIEERHEEKLLMLGPVLERLHNELLDPLIERTFAVMLNHNLIPPAPPELEDVELRVEYISVLAQAQRAVGTASVERLAGFVGNLAAINPEVMDKFDMDQAVDEYADMLGTPPKLVVPDDKVAQRRKDRARMQQAAQAAEVAQQAGTAAKTLSETDTEGKNALTDILGGGAG